MIDTCLPVIVLTYPAHFYQTVLCIDSVKKYTNCSSITVVVDDRSNLVYDSYIDDCTKTYNVDKIIIGSTAFDNDSFDPWCRQQMIKLNLDRILSDDTVLFVDGDTVLTAAIPASKLGSVVQFQGPPIDTAASFTECGPGDVSTQITNYIRYVLGINFEFLHNPASKNTIITVSDPPIKLLSLSILTSLKKFVAKHHNKSFDQVHTEILKNTLYAMSEWELIEAFGCYVLDDKIPVYTDDLSFFSNTWKSDRELGKEWFDGRVQIDDNIWQKLPLKKHI